MLKKILKIFTGVVILVLISKALGFVREALVAAKYGVGFVSDVYVFEDGVINTLYTIWAGVISTTFIPLSNLVPRNSRNRYISNYLNAFLFIILGICVIAFLFTSEILHLFVPGFFELYDSSVMQELVLITRVNIASLILVFLENFFIVLLQANNIFVFSSIQGIILNSSLIIYLGFFQQYEIWGIVDTKILAHLLNVIMLGGYIKWKRLYKYEPYINLRESYVKELIRLAIPVFILNLISQFNYIVDRSMASMLDTGSMAILNYANVISNLLYAVLGMSLSTMAYTDMSKLQENKILLEEMFHRYTKMLLGILIPAALVMICIRENIVLIFYGRGKLSNDSVIMITNVMLLYIPSNFCFSIRDLTNRLLYINKKTLIPSLITGGAFVLNVSFNILLVSKLGLYGLAAATSFASVIATIATWLYAYKQKYISSFIRVNILKCTLFVITCICLVLLGKYLKGNQFIQVLSIPICAFAALFLYNLDLLIAEMKKLVKNRGLK